MSIEPEDTLEEALRGDLPTPAIEARVRRRLLAAGVAVGQGVATTTAAAAGAGSVGAKLAGLSWGLKLGLAAAVTIPTVGLLLEGSRKETVPTQTPVVVTAQSRAKVDAEAVAPDAPRVAVVAEPRASAPERRHEVGKAPAPEAARARDVEVATAPPSQADFAATPAPPGAPRVGSTLAEETRLLDGAFAELAAGNRSRAATLIHEHEARFPAGLLMQERERAKARLSEISRGE